MPGKVIIFSAPSGSGKTTIVRELLARTDSLEFSVSATSRPPRVNEVNGVEYYFLSPAEFRQKIKNGDFAEWEEVYKDLFYGTLTSEITRIWKKGHHALFDVDVKGGLNLKRKFGQDALSFFVKVPDMKILEERLRNRHTENEASIRMRLRKAESETKFAEQFDVILLNDKLNEAVDKAYSLVMDFIGN